MPNRRPGKKTQRGSPTSSDRARQTAAVGACRKATTGVSTMVSFEESDDLSWAKDLLPARKPAATRCWSPPAPPEADWDLPFAGLHFAALTAPGPSGTRLAERASLRARQQNPCCSVRPLLQNVSWHAPASRPLAHACAVVEEKWQTETHQDGRAPVLGLRQAL